jgi:hypothetical protein
MLGISSKQELSEPHRLTAPIDDVAQCGSITAPASALLTLLFTFFTLNSILQNFF